VIVGAGYTDETIDEVRVACRGKGKLPWLKVDVTNPPPPLGPNFAPTMAGRAKACMQSLTRTPKLGHDGVYLFDQSEWSSLAEVWSVAYSRYLQNQKSISCLPRQVSFYDMGLYFQYLWREYVLVQIEMITLTLWS
jgi:hypothetical protein